MDAPSGYLRDVADCTSCAYICRIWQSLVSPERRYAWEMWCNVYVYDGSRMHISTYIYIYMAEEHELRQ